MNARQKAKKYKQELERLKEYADPGRTVSCNVDATTWDIVEFRADVDVDPFLPRDVVKRDLIRRLVSDIGEEENLFEIETIRLPWMDRTRMIMRLEVVKRRD